MKRATILAAAALFALATLAPAQAAPWFAKGSYYAGVAGQWNSDPGNEMFDDGTNGDAVAADGVHSRLVTSDQPAGKYEYKVALDDWSVSHPLSSNQFVYVNAMNEQILFTLDTNVHADGWIPAENIAWNPNAMPLGAVPEVIGGAPELGDWNVGQIATLSGGVWRITINFATAGSYEYKWRANGNWDDFIFGNDGAASAGGNLVVDVLNDGESYVFELDTATGRARAVEEGTVSVETDTWGGVKGLFR